MRIIAGKTFWGLVIILIGFALLMNQLVGWGIPVFTIIVSVFLIMLGIQLVSKPSQSDQSGSGTTDSRESTVIFSSEDNTINPDHLKHEYNNIFGSRILNFKHLTLSEQSINVEINTIFGDSRVFIPSNLPYELNANTVFGQTKTPDDIQSSIGEQTSKKDTEAVKPKLIMESNTVFGAFKVTEV
jgi:predicted membrane protein